LFGFICDAQGLLEYNILSLAMRFGGKTEVEGTPNEPTYFFPFSKPSPFSSMTDWPFGSQQTMTDPPKHT
jgi:hypothetical protein